MIYKFVESIGSCTSSATTVKYMSEELKSEGFKELPLNEEFAIEKGGKYYINVYGTSLIAFVAGKNIKDLRKIRFLAAHTDMPALLIKPNPQMRSGQYGRLNIEIYGGPILNTWLDRPLSISGRVSLRSDNVVKPDVRVVDFKDALMVIPNLAIHMNRDVNKGIELNKQTQMLPLICLMDGMNVSDDYFMEMLADKLDVSKEDILDYQLYAYNCQEAYFTGLNKEMLLAPRIDNIASVFSCVEAIKSASLEDGLAIIGLYDNEEVGSATKQGAQSYVTVDIIRRIGKALGISTDIMDGFTVSLDVAHGTHPNYTEKSDPTNTVNLNGGLVIKKAANQGYATDCVSGAIVKAICEQNGIKNQSYVNRSDIGGGRTLGSILSANLPLPTVDVGIPILAMHSACELMGTKDIEYMTQFCKCVMNI